MSLAFKVAEQYNDTRTTKVYGTLVFSGNYTTGGDTLNLGVLSVDNFPKLLKVASPPVYFNLNGQGLYTYLYVPGTTINNGKVKIISLATQAELAAGAYPGGVTGDTVTFEFSFTKYK